MVVGLCRAGFIVPSDQVIVHRKLGLRPLFIPKTSKTSFCAASMEAPPEGYRKNVGICLANSSMNKVSDLCKIAPFIMDSNFMRL